MSDAAAILAALVAKHAADMEWFKLIDRKLAELEDLVEAGGR